MSALFEDIKVRPMRDRQGVKLSSSSVQNLYSRSAYKKGDSGHAFAKKFVTIRDEINSGIDVPQKSRHDSRQQWPLTIAILPRSVKYVLYNEDPDPPRDFRPGPLEYMHKDTAFNMSRPTVRVRAEDIPEDFYQMMALDMLSGQEAAAYVNQWGSVGTSNGEKSGAIV